MNLMTVIYKKRAFLIDCGLMFPDASTPGVDIIVPRIDFFKDEGIEIDGIVLTHGHEDHIGALGYLLEDLNFPPIWGTPFTLALVEERLKQVGLLKKATLKAIKPPQTFTIGPHRFRTAQVTHSVVDSMGLIIDTPIGTLVHSGDFKMEKEPLDGKNFDENAFRKAGAEGVTLLLSDSTNIERPGWSRPEKEVSVALKDVFKSIRSGKIIVGVFASNIHRVQQIHDAAIHARRKIAFLGRSMLTNIEIAERLGHLKLQQRHVIQAKEIERYNAQEIVLCVTGTQAEPRSVLYRLSLNDHHECRILEGDTVVFSSRHIPGNERNISHLVNNLYRRGAMVIDSDMAAVHASGHAYREEQKLLLEWTRPKLFLPVHGEYRMLVKHLALAKETLADVQGIVAENGDLIEVTKDRISIVGKAPSGKVFLDEAAGDLHEELIRDRLQMAHTGLVVLSVVIDGRRGKIIEGPNFDIRGISDFDTDELRQEVTQRLLELSREARGDEIEVQEELRRSVRRFFRRTSGVKPVVIPLVYEV